MLSFFFNALLSLFYFTNKFNSTISNLLEWSIFLLPSLSLEISYDKNQLVNVALPCSIAMALDAAVLIPY